MDPRLRQRIEESFTARFPADPPGTRPYPPPGPFADWLGKLVLTVPDGTVQDLARAAFALAYGPVEAGLPAEPVLAGLLQPARFPEPDAAGVLDPAALRRAVERALALVLRLPPPPAGRGWEARWFGAYQALYEMISRIIRPVLYELYGVFHEPTESLQEWVDRETEDGARMLCAQLLGGCDCWRRAEQLSLDEEVAVVNCQRDHRLAAWDGESPLDSHLRRAVLNDARWPQANALRHGMLTKLAGEGQLWAGRVLRCARRGCSGEIQPANDRCDVCRQPTTVVRPPFWFWREGQRRPGECRRCAADNFLYFRWADHPERGWEKITRVWVPARVLELQESPGSGAGPEEPILRAEVAARVQQIPEGDGARAVAERYLLQGQELADVANALGHNLAGLDFLRLMAGVVRPLQDLVTPLPVEDRWDERMRTLARGLLRTARGLESIAGDVGAQPGQRSFRETAAAVLIMALRELRGRPGQTEEADDDHAGD
jgi:hypothetical protein